ncbi:hypothetical protein [Streptomyces humicola]|uniref:hypothetical protein n=1 Tax=Streptomyces humicola TaxID=2953240 RepID=UPI0027E2C0A1|nr:hypothetical protein [Streptomyces humicola]
MLILVQDAAESITSSDVAVVESVRFGDRLGEWAQGCCGLKGAVGPVLGVEGVVLVVRVEQMDLVPDQGGRSAAARISLPPVIRVEDRACRRIIADPTRS